ncbi:MAG: type II and III secretion system protein [Spirochaetia bacterium]|nr:type II and III secretion system protein [Spirochaetia bacterium]
MLTNGFKIDAQLDALETQSKASLLSSPKIAVGDNSKARIETTRTTYYMQTKIQEQANAAPVISTEYVAVTLPITLEVAAKITENNTIMMNVDLAVAKILSASTGNAPPETTNQKATTIVTAMNNETVVIGGLISETVTMKENKVPLLGDLPLIGGLFKSTTDEKQKVELVVFLTPSILDED